MVVLSSSFPPAESIVCQKGATKPSHVIQTNPGLPFQSPHQQLHVPNEPVRHLLYHSSRLTSELGVDGWKAPWLCTDLLQSMFVGQCFPELSGFQHLDLTCSSGICSNILLFERLRIKTRSVKGLVTKWIQHWDCQHKQTIHRHLRSFLILPLMTHIYLPYFN